MSEIFNLINNIEQGCSKSETDTTDPVTCRKTAGAETASSDSHEVEDYYRAVGQSE